MTLTFEGIEPADAIAAKLDESLARVASGTDALGVLCGPDDAVGMGMLVDPGGDLRRHWRTVLRVMVHPEHQGAPVPGSC